MNHPEFEHRITVRLPRPLAAALNKQCDRDDTNVSVIVRESLVEHLSPKEPRQ